MTTFAGFAHPPEQNAKLLYNFFWEGLLLMEVYSYQWSGPNSQGGRGNFTYLLEGQINFALKLSVGCLISQF